MMQCRPATVSYILRGIAQAVQMKQAAGIATCLQELQAHPALCLIEKVKFDETAQAVTTSYKTRHRALPQLMPSIPGSRLNCMLGEER